MNAVTHEAAKKIVASLRGFRGRTAIRVLTPGSTAGEPLRILSALEHRAASWSAGREASRAATSAAISLVLRLLGKDADPARSREHVLLSVLAERRMQGTLQSSGRCSTRC